MRSQTALLIVVGWLFGRAPSAPAQVTPITGHYPPGQSGIRGASTPDAGVSLTNFNRFFTNLRVVGDSSDDSEDLDELRYANITMVTWTSDWELPLGLTYGTMAGVPFATGDLSQPAGESGFGLGDVLVTPIALYGTSPALDATFQFTVWTPSGHFSPGSGRNRGTGFWALVYSLGGVWYPDRDRAWSLSALARFEQNFEQRETGIDPGHDVVVDWGIGRLFRVADRPLDVGVSGFAVAQLTLQDGGPDEAQEVRYRLVGLGPEMSFGIVGPFSVRLRAHWEIAARHIVRGNNLWLILNYRWATNGRDGQG